ncbi:hypothetical protein [Burkholderia ubonensis]|uniref:hypothetical protein n=1 Tax=Burkholderia ubonensis TaxID=101571 RepID=UPI0008FE961A|nr:hypothetical protein [Burkholderia ubonensis]OJA60398.1 hypothetical protein BGV69_05670 [Burkholderia ubonensis]
MKNWKFVIGLLATLAGVFAVAFCGAWVGGDGKYDRAIMAYWMQGVGSIAAIFGALRIASSQRADAERLRLQEERAERARKFDERLDLIDLVLVLCDEAVDAIEMLHDQTAVKRLRYFRSSTIEFTFRELETIASQLARVPLEELGSPAIARDVIRATRILRMILSFEPDDEDIDLSGLEAVSAKTLILNRIQNIRLIRSEVAGSIAPERLETGQ